MSDHVTKNQTDCDDTCVMCNIKDLLGLSIDTSEKEVMRKLKKLTNSIEKPCTEHYAYFPDENKCPYGTLVKEYPGIPMDRDEAEGMDEFNRETLARGGWPGGKPLTKECRAQLQEEVDSFDPLDYPELPAPLANAKCVLFECACPAFFPMQIAASKKTN